MPSLEAYSRSLNYSYALGLFPASELMKKRPELARRLAIPFADAGEWDVALGHDGVHFLPEGHAAFARGLGARLEALLERQG